MNLKKRNLAGVLVMSSALMLWSCGDAPQADEAITQSEVEVAEVPQETEENVSKVKDIFYAVPSTMEMASILKKTGATYDMSLLNDVKRVNDYSSAAKQALNLGVYGADLSYASIFNQNQESIIYLSCTKKLADKLGVTKAFDDSTIERMEANVENRDSLLSIVSETYYILDAYLKENGRDNISAMVIAAGWVEGLYLAATIAAADTEEPNEQLIQRLAEQKLSLGNLQKLVEAYNSDNSLDGIMDDLSRIEAAYGGVNIESEKATTSQDEDGVTVIGGGVKKVSLSPEQLQEITTVVSEIRNSYVS